MPSEAMNPLEEEVMASAESSPATTQTTASGGGGGGGASASEGAKNKSKNKNKKKKKPKTKPPELIDPEKILADILEATSFKVANLSLLVEEKFFEAPEYSSEIRRLLADIRYESTLDTLDESQISVMPLGYDPKRVLAEASAMTEMSCIYQQPVKRVHLRRSKKSRAKQINQQQQEKHEQYQKLLEEQRQQIESLSQQ